MVSKTISIINDKGMAKKADGTATTTWQIGSQTALDNVLRRYKVDTLLDHYHCEVFDFRALIEGRTYALGETTASQTFELIEQRPTRTISTTRSKTTTPIHRQQTQ